MIGSPSQDLRLEDGLPQSLVLRLYLSILLVSSDIKLVNLFANLLAHISGSLLQSVVTSRKTLVRERK